jgi:membrane-associated phospholipid phosphatase
VFRILAVDWSGARTGEQRAIWLAEAREGRLVRLEDGRDREQLVAHLLEEAERDEELVVGLDFAFSLPEWFLRARGIVDVSNAWDLVSREAEAWLRDPQPPFWRTRRPVGPVGFRRTELECGGRPKSVFQLVGAGQVGTGTLRGIPFLPRLRERFAIWPFDPPRLPLIVEIYPRLYLDGSDGYPNEHARDAAAAALAMSRWTGDWRRLPRDPRYALEGRIWHSGAVSAGG